MHIVDIHLENFCKHRDQTVSFHERLNGIIGPNGSGKSTITNAIYSTITGEFSRFHGIKLENVCQYASSSDRSTITLNLQHQTNTQVQIFRGIRPSTRKLTIGGTVYKRETEINEMLESLFGLPPKVVGEYLFVEQGQLAAFLDDIPSNRTKSLHRLFRLDKAEDCYKALAFRLSRLPKLLVNDGIQLKAKIEQYKQQVVDLTTKINELEKFDPIYESDLSMQSQLFQNETNLQTKLNNTTNELNKLNKEKLIFQEKMQQSKKYSTDEVKKYKKYLQQLDLESCVEEQKEVLKKKYDKLCKSKIDKPIEVPAWSNTEEDELSQLKAELFRLHEYVRLFDPKTGISNCPTCYCPTDNLAKDYPNYVARLEDVVKSVSVRELKKKTWQNYKEDISKYNEWKAAYDVESVRIEEELTKLNNSKLPPVPLTREEIIKFLREAASAIDNTSKIHNELSGINGEIKQLNKESDSILNELNNVIVGLELYSTKTKLANEKEVVAAYEECRKNVTLKLELESKNSMTQQILKDLEDEYKQLQKDIKISVKTESWRETLSKLADIYHRDALPKDIAQSYLEDLEDSVNNNLNELGVDFRIKVGPNLSFKSIYPDGRALPDNRFSGGEKIIFSIAWRLAVNAAFANDVGILCLDEPTDGLDEDRKKSLRDALPRIRDFAGSRGLQCIIVTHERSFLPLFDKVIELKA